MKCLSALILLFFSVVAYAQKTYVSEVWVADNGDGTYKNPIIYADYSDPDVVHPIDLFSNQSIKFFHELNKSPTGDKPFLS